MIYINIGTNSGDRRANLARAVAAIVSHPLLGAGTVRCSTIVESEPWGYLSANPYLNQGLAIDINGDPTSVPWLHSLLDATQAIERSLSATPHRNPDGSYRDREIDIDIIAVDTLAYSDTRLTLPHPRMHLRDFVLLPMAELAPGWRHPHHGLTAAELLQRLQA
ncbi:MAG: 2-amino-4-hydroxy-6-hydroxymethyldihydropteridine diphosphokinase [Muribaculaceae bacterium]|nr:2-amino-4-hydroxy-6-hydroxymethyldihydropteridine diphosphokinase [Muribaculaceae bacterium]